MAFAPCHVWVTLNGRHFKVVFKPNGKASHIMEWKGRAVYTRYWSSASRSRPGSLSARIVAAAEEIRG